MKSGDKSSYDYPRDRILMSVSQNDDDPTDEESSLIQALTEDGDGIMHIARRTSYNYITPLKADLYIHRAEDDFLSTASGTG